MRLALFMPSFGDGGVERMLVNLAGGLVERGVQVDFLTRSRKVPYLDRLDARVRLIETGKSGRLSVQPAMCRYLREARPDFVLCGKDRAAQAALLARRLSGVPFELVMRPGTTVSERVARRGFIKRWRAFRLIRSTYGSAAAVVGNSEGVVRDVQMIAELPDARMHLIRNPVVTPDLAAQAAEPVEHPWFALGEPPVIVGVGGLRTQKGFDTLLRAFAQVRAQRACRLLILGEGRLREELQDLARELDVAEDFALPGFDQNPYRFVARAGLFVLASRWEGSPNALTEALGLGAPVVATDCPSGPREILAGGTVAPLVPVDDVAALAAAMNQVLDNPGDAQKRRAAVAEYTVETCAARYHALFEKILWERR
ncbi:glycosyltransferase [Azoarcus sp. KH32C]|uniref:glycosyltransferase n=1 Tax=Azoarcus sp. KH32C TaxID=748247 RepID=UPI0002385FB0|nr:glycosyltransferase [Azoarcus sp. KH32C]BAL22945.1 glycosyltransferase family protein [Azoarcus sp. KH32C]